MSVKRQDAADARKLELAFPAPGACSNSVLGMELDGDRVDNGVVDFAVKPQQQLAPLFRAQL